MTTLSLFDAVPDTATDSPVYRSPQGERSGKPIGVSPDSRLARVHDLFVARRGEWISSDELQKVGGRCAWRTRVSDCRRLLGMEITNRQRRVEGANGEYVVSEYGYKVNE